MKSEIEKLCKELSEAMCAEIELEEQIAKLKLLQNPAHTRTLRVKDSLRNIVSDK